MKFPGELFFGRTGAHSIHPEVVDEMGVRDWNYTHANPNSTASYPHRDWNPAEVPDNESFFNFQDYWGEKTRSASQVEDAPPKWDTSRPTLARSFEQAQQRAIIDYEVNPLITELGLNLDFPVPPEVDPDLEGVVWAANLAANEILGRDILHRPLASQLGARNCGAIVARYLNRRRPVETLTRLSSLHEAITFKYNTVNREKSHWINRAQLPVLAPDLSIHHPLNAVMLATVVTALSRIETLTGRIESFYRGASECLRACR
jgi:hypothetical protein